MAARHGAGMSVLDWRERLVCSLCDKREIDTVLIEPTRRRLSSGTAYRERVPEGLDPGSAENGADK
jgi:hypothetical protein